MVERTRVKIFSGKRKTAVARAVIREGSGRVRINGVPLEIWQPEVARMRIIQTLMLAGDIARKYDIDVYVRGGGFMGQAEAVSIAIARALVGMSRSTRLERIYREFDRHLLVGDPRRTEPKKPLGPGPRRKKQTSYR
ncbi:30S ribosomal protein S9 [Candidatus Geothermarchaeota archaeon ex4572_27]|nr:MAG: 30S ribosomal protein S9 [Candidatus Geothermarchaeota archaeon ex4572_27]